MALTKNVRLLIQNLVKTADSLISDLSVLNDIERLRDPISARQAVFDGTTLNLDFYLNQAGIAPAVRAFVLARTNLSKGAIVVLKSKATLGAGWTTRATIQPWTQSGLGADDFGADLEPADGYPSDEEDPLPSDPLWYAFLGGSADAAITDSYWRATITDSANPVGKIAIGLVYLGDFWEAKQATVSEYTNADQVTFRYVDNSETVRSRSGSTWINPLQIYREWSLNFDGINTQDLFDVLVPEIAKHGNSSPFFGFFAPEDGAAPIVTSRSVNGRESNRMAAYVIAEGGSGNLQWTGGGITGSKQLTALSGITLSETW